MTGLLAATCIGLGIAATLASQAAHRHLFGWAAEHRDRLVTTALDPIDEELHDLLTGEA